MSENQEKATAPQSSRSRKPRTNGKIRTSKSQDSAKLCPVPTKHNDHKLRDPKSIEVRKRLGITPEQMRGVPRISHLLDCASGGIAECINALRLSDDPDACKFLEAYDALSQSDRQRVSIEEIATAAGVGTKNLLAATLLAMDYVGTSQARMATSSFKAPVIAATANAAINGKNATANRKLFLSGVEFLPRPANRDPGVFVNITNQNAAAARAMHEATEPPPEIPVAPAATIPGYVNAEEHLRLLHGEIDGQENAPAVADLGEAVEVGGAYEDEELSCIPESNV